MKTRRMTIRNPVGGVVKRTSYQDQPDFTAYAAENVWPDNVSDGRQRLGVRPGLATAVTGTLPGPIRMMHEINVQTETGTESVLVCSAGGNFYRRVASTGQWGSAISTSYTLATDRLIQAAVFGQKLYIADYGIVDSGTDLECSGTTAYLPSLESGTDGATSADGLTFTSTGSTFVTEGVTAGVDVLRITVTGSGTGNANVDVYEIASVDSETQLTLSTSAASGTDTGVTFVVRPSLANIGVTYEDHGLEVLESGNGTDGFYTISSVDEDQVSLSTSPGTTTGIHYRFHRTPKVWDLTDDSISKWTASNGGTLPLSCSVIAYFQDRIVLAGAPSTPNVWYASKQGDPLDFDYDGDSAASAVAGTNFANGQIGDPITALIPHNRQCLVIGAEDSLYVMRGDPNSPSSTIDQLSAHLGPISPQAWCKDAEFHTWMLTRDGLYRMASGCGDTPDSFSREKLPDALLNLDVSDYVPQLKYDLLQRAVHVYVPTRTVGADVEDASVSGAALTSSTITDWSVYNVQVGDVVEFFDITTIYKEVVAVSGGTITLEDTSMDGYGGTTCIVHASSQNNDHLAYWVDTVRGGIWPMDYDDGLYPTSVCEYGVLTSDALSSVILGGADGVARQHDRDTTTDAGSAFTGTCTIGPFRISKSSMQRALVRSARIITSQETGTLSWTIRAGNTPENVARDEIRGVDGVISPLITTRNKNLEFRNERSYSDASGYNQIQHPRVSGHACAILLSGTGAQSWGIEGIELEVAEGGRLR